MVYPAIILILAAAASAFVTAEIAAPLVYFVMLTLYFCIVFWVAFETVPNARRKVARAYRRMEERRAFERQIFRALWDEGRI